MPNPIKPTKWTQTQEEFAQIIRAKAMETGCFTKNETEALLLGLMIGGPLGLGCPDWRVRSMGQQIETGPKWERTLFHDLVPQP